MSRNLLERVASCPGDVLITAVSINYFAYTFIQIHRTLRVTPAMVAGVAGRLFDVSDLVNLLIESESKKAA